VTIEDDYYPGQPRWYGHRFLWDLAIIASRAAIFFPCAAVATAITQAA
jgi:hypothetical protein